MCIYKRKKVKHVDPAIQKELKSKYVFKDTSGACSCPQNVFFIMRNVRHKIFKREFFSVEICESCFGKNMPGLMYVSDKMVVLGNRFYAWSLQKSLCIKSVGFTCRFLFCFMQSTHWFCVNTSVLALQGMLVGNRGRQAYLKKKFCIKPRSFFSFGIYKIMV